MVHPVLAILSVFFLHCLLSYYYTVKVEDLTIKLTKEGCLNYSVQMNLFLETDLVSAEFTCKIQGCLVVFVVQRGVSMVVQQQVHLKS